MSASGTTLHWIPQWIALFAGILVQPFFDNYRQTGEWSLDGFSGWCFFALIVAFMVFPSVYKNAFDPEKPVVVQVAPIFTAGMGWESLFEAAKKAAGG